MVTGAAGFIGSTLVDKLLEKKFKVVGYDNFNEYYSGKEKNLINAGQNKDFFLVRADILDYPKLVESLNGVDIVFHLAGQPGVRYSLENPESTKKINIEGTSNVLNACKENNVKKLIFASTSSVYENTQASPIDEEHKTKPLSVYGSSKLEAETLCKGFSKDLDVVILRYHSVYGPRGRPDMAVYKWTELIFNKKPITVFGDGNQTRDMTYVDDIVDGTIRASQVDGISGEIFNLANGKNVSMNYVLKLIEEYSGNKPIIQYQEKRKDEAQDTLADIKKAKTVLGFDPKITVEEGLKRTINWHKKLQQN